MTDILVIGGGIAGLSAAAHLAPQAQVTLLEAEEALGYHASGRSAALFEENYGSPSVKALSRASADFHRDGGYLSPRGFLLTARSDDGDLFEADLAELGCREISVGEALSMVPILNPSTVKRAAYHDAAQDIDTDRMLQDLARRVREYGGKVLTRRRVAAISRNGKAWQVTCGEEIHTASMLVNAAGAWADSIARLAGIAPLGLVPCRRSMARIPAPDGRDVSGWPMFFGAGETWYAKPDAGKLLVSPADETPVEPHDAWADDLDLAEGIARYQENVTVEVTRVETTWAGLRTFAPDRTLVLGPDPAMPSFVWSAGQGGYGFQTGPAAGRLVAQLTLGEVPDLPREIVTQLRPDRLAG